MKSSRKYEIQGLDEEWMKNGGWEEGRERTVVRNTAAHKGSIHVC